MSEDLSDSPVLTPPSLYEMSRLENIAERNSKIQGLKTKYEIYKEDIKEKKNKPEPTEIKTIFDKQKLLKKFIRQLNPKSAGAKSLKNQLDEVNKVIR